MFKRIRQRWQNTSSALLEEGRELGADITEDRHWLKAAFWLVLALFIALFCVGLYWSSEPAMFPVQAPVVDASGNTAARVTGVATTSAMIQVTETLLNKRGGYLTNDLMPPGVWLDNIPNWEYGVLVQVRDLARVMRESYSRSQSQSVEDSALKDAEAQFNFNRDSWILPSTEDEYRRGIAYLHDYRNRLVDADEQNAQFYARADNLRFWLGTVETRLGSLSQKLSASVGQRRLNVDLAGEKAARQSTATPGEFEVKTPWNEVDDVFYEARGAAWALVHFLRAAEIDFADVLADKNARVSFEQIIRELEGTQASLRSPIILNGGGFGMLANHSLVMANYISRANAALIDLRELLARG
ncbi:MAG: DUF2333 family protein [Cellvibrionaceae bacterium]|nr:DUF2333 family protein [Cellvibrionaceae bacterium]